MHGGLRDCVLDSRNFGQYQVSSPCSPTSLDSPLTPTRSLPLSSLEVLVEALLSQLPEDNAPAVIVVKPERPGPVTRTPSTRVDPNRPKYDPSMIFVLELATVLTLRDEKTLEVVGEKLATTLQTLVRDAKNLHPLTVSRVVSYLLNLLRLSHVCVLKASCL